MRVYKDDLAFEMWSDEYFYNRFWNPDYIATLMWYGFIPNGRGNVFSSRQVER